MVSRFVPQAVLYVVIIAVCTATEWLSNRSGVFLGLRMSVEALAPFLQARQPSPLAPILRGSCSSVPRCAERPKHGMNLASCVPKSTRCAIR